MLGFQFNIIPKMCTQTKHFTDLKTENALKDRHILFLFNMNKKWQVQKNQL